MAAGALVLAGVIAAAADVTAPRIAAAPLQFGPNHAGPNRGYGTATSANWAGYGVSGGTFTKVAGAWVQPRATCPPKPSEGAAFWVGIDGLASTDKTVEQIGTDSDCIAGTPTYYIWFQMYPKAAVFPSPTKFPVVAGETINAQVSAVAKTFTLALSATSGGVVKWRYSIKQTVKTLPSESSAEWIAEAPCVGNPCKTVPLANFGTVNFSGLSLVGKATDPKTGFTDTQITMTVPKTSTVKARPSALAPGKTAFSVTWLHV